MIRIIFSFIYLFIHLFFVMYHYKVADHRTSRLDVLVRKIQGILLKGSQNPFLSTTGWWASTLIHPLDSVHLGPDKTPIGEARHWSSLA